MPHLSRKPVARFELATSSLPRKHTAGLCHIGAQFWNNTGYSRRKNSGLLHRDRLPNYVVSTSYKTLRRSADIPRVFQIIFFPAHPPCPEYQNFSNRLILCITPGRVATSMTGLIPDFLTACITAGKSIVPSPTAACESAVPSLSWR